MKSHFLTGKLTLQEDIEIITENRIAKTFVAHVASPLKSYYSRYTSISKPYSILFFTAGSISKEKIIRATKIINKNRKSPIDGAKARVVFNGKTYYAIRVRGIQRFNYIAEIQQEFQQQGFVFDRSRFNFDTVNALIRVSRFFNMSKLSAGIYKSNKMEDMYYIELPHPTSWEEFSKITFEIKNNIASHNYDVVKGLIYFNEDVVDILRVMKPSITIDQLKEIQERYWQRMTDLKAVDNLI